MTAHCRESAWEEEGDHEPSTDQSSMLTATCRSEVVGRPLAALLANDGARVFSVDIGDIQEFNRRHRSKDSAGTAHLPHHVVKRSKMSLEECLRISDVVITGVPSKEYKVKTEHLKDGVVAVNFSSEKNFEADIKEKVGVASSGLHRLIACSQPDVVARMHRPPSTFQPSARLPSRCFRGTCEWRRCGLPLLAVHH